MTGVATGGFVVTADGIAAYNSMLIEAVAIPFMLLGAISFAVHYYLLQGDVDLLWDDAQTRWLFALTGVGTVIVGGILLATYPSLDAARYGAFQLISALTCTGFQTDTGLGDRWPVAGQIVVMSAMVIGGAAGSTAGGIKLIRAISLTKGTLYSVTDYFYEEDTRDFAIADEEADVTAGQTSTEFDQAAVIGFLWIVLLVVVVLVSLIGLPTGQKGYALGDVLFEVASAQGNVGLSAGITDSGMPSSVKLAFVASMWIGRLEIIPILVMMRVLILGFE
ncbi:hypothetical protein MW046_16550 (plasmid) [Halocatena salina]|uniref:Uncharacterized protein n=2 Tax=Halocatena salina TaxID=2934340 RepID=A0A8U0A820_9EURY|nr:hypothetical protein MW046_16550 [Halocatena salina]